MKRKKGVKLLWHTPYPKFAWFVVCPKYFLAGPYDEPDAHIHNTGEAADSRCYDIRLQRYRGKWVLPRK